MNDITLFQFESHAVRATLDEHGEPWFVGKDVAELLGYEEPGNAIRQHCKGGGEIHPPSNPRRNAGGSCHL
jgi:prophage antirepressor-like protein